MSVNDEQTIPWLAEEKRFIRDAISAGKRVLGVCLGAQLIANALGASVYPNREKEIGWFAVQSVDQASDASTFRFPKSVDVFHWHGETFDLPVGSVRLARSDACENQAFQFGASVIGLQFHLETTPESAREIVSHCKDELQASRYIQSESDILSAGIERYEAINALMGSLLSYLEKSRN